MTAGTWSGVSARVIGDIYRDPTSASWAEALELVAEVHRAPWVHVHLDDQDIESPRISALNSGADPGVIDRFIAGGFGPLDPRPALVTANDGLATACWQLVSPEEFDRTLYVNEFLDRPENDIRWSMAAGKTLGSGARMMLGIARGRQAGAFEPQDVAEFAALAPHIIGAVELHESLRMAERAARLPAQLAEQEQVAILGIDRRGRVVFANAKGEAALARDPDLAVANGQVRFKTPHVQSVLEAALSNPDDAPPAKLTHGMLQIKIQTLPAIASIAASALPPIRVLMEMRELAGPSLIGALSKRERHVAELLAKGLTPPEIADALGKSVETVRTQLKAAMRKVNVNRQSQLVRAMLGAQDS